MLWRLIRPVFSSHHLAAHALFCRRRPARRRRNWPRLAGLLAIGLGRWEARGSHAISEAGAELAPFRGSNSRLPRMRWCGWWGWVGRRGIKTRAVQWRPPLTPNINWAGYSTLPHYHLRVCLYGLSVCMACRSRLRKERRGKKFPQPSPLPEANMAHPPRETPGQVGIMPRRDVGVPYTRLPSDCVPGEDKPPAAGAGPGRQFSTRVDNPDLGLHC